MLSFLLTCLAARGEEEPRTSVTFSPLHLAWPLVEITGERAAGKRGGVALIAGYGGEWGYGLSQFYFDEMREELGVRIEDYAVFEAGAQGRLYPAGSFQRGLQIGAELLRRRSRYTLVVDDFSGDGKLRTWLFSPFVGAKLATAWGLTVDFQVGPQFWIARSTMNAEVEVTSSSGEDTFFQVMSTSETAGRRLMLNLNLGWSF